MDFSLWRSHKLNTKIALTTQRSSDITEEERESARLAIKGFQQFLRQLWAARQHDQRLINVLEKNPGTESSSLFEQRHLLRRFQQEVKDRYTKLIFAFAGKNDKFFVGGFVHLLSPLEKDTKTRQIKESLQDSMQQLTQFIEEFLEAFEDFNNKDQITKIVSTSKKADQIIQTMENIIERQLRPHFEKNVLKNQKQSSIRANIKKRARLIRLLGE
jgi:hypothetical protein